MAMAGVAAGIDLQRCPSSSTGSAAGAWSRGGVEQGRGGDARRCAAPPPAPHRWRASSSGRCGPLSHLRRHPFPHLWLRRLSVRGTVPLLPLHSVCSDLPPCRDLPPCLERLGWCASAWARRPIRASRRIQAERDAAGYGVAAAERNHCVQFDVPRCSLKTAKVIWRSLCWPYPGASADSLNPFHLQDASLRWRSLANECRRLSRAGL
jgi:hypothetical protein